MACLDFNAASPELRRQLKEIERARSWAQAHTPTHYTDREGGEWMPWPFTPGLKIICGQRMRGLGGTKAVLTLYALSSGMTDARQCQAVVHSLRFEDGREWDCLNGWRRLH